MSKYYVKHTNASGFSIYRRPTLLGIIGFVINLYNGESLTIIRSGGELETKLSNHPDLYKEL